MPCLHLSFYQGKNLLRSSYLTLVHSSSVYTSSNNSSWSVNTPAICIIYVMKSNWREILKPCSLQEAFVAIAFYFLIQEPQTETSRFLKMSMLQHLKRSRRKRMVLLQIALKNTRRARRLQWINRSKLRCHHVHRRWPHSIILRGKFRRLIIRRVRVVVCEEILWICSILPGGKITRPLLHNEGWKFVWKRL